MRRAVPVPTKKTSPFVCTHGRKVPGVGFCAITALQTADKRILFSAVNIASPSKHYTASLSASEVAALSHSASSTLEGPSLVTACESLAVRAAVVDGSLVFPEGEAQFSFVCLCYSS